MASLCGLQLFAEIIKITVRYTVAVVDVVAHYAGPARSLICRLHMCIGISG